MVVRKEKKRRRGLHTYHGAKKKWRGAGSRGGRGHSGRLKHKKSLLVKDNRKYLSAKSLHRRVGHKFGFKLPAKTVRLKEINSIKIRDLDILANKLGLKEINLADYGFQKVLSGGKMTKPVSVTAQKFTEGAKEEIEKVGGKAIEG
ncbi:MAG: uL15 family ribosomal protein [Candidatus Aenigmarchaeota archaeon]|nr:uL15 family ribosomal protein [Candidatus Aenigmarchaeota archaeon]